MEEFVRVVQGFCPDLRGKKVIGQGSRAVVFDLGDRVAKVTIDPAAAGFMRVCWDLAGRAEHFFPVVYDYYGEVGDYDYLPVFRADMEKLRSDRGTQLSMAQEFEARKKGCESKAFARMVDAAEGLLDVVAEGGAFVDKNVENFMRRPKTGEIVFVDPLATSMQDLQTRSQWRLDELMEEDHFHQYG